MIGFAIPWIFAMAAVAAVGVVLLHFLSVQQPRVLSLPTTRFVPEHEAQAVSRQAKPSDLLLLALRVLALLAAGAALAGVRCGRAGARVVHLVAIDASRRADSAAVLRRVAVWRADAAIADDVRPTPMWVRGLHDDPGAAIAAAIRTAAAAAQQNPALAELSLSVMMPATVRSRAGWDAWRGQWPGTIGVLAAAVLPRAAGLTVRVVGVASTEDDAVVASVLARGWTPRDGDDADVTVVRSRALDLGEVFGGVGDTSTIVVHWPVDGAPRGWQARVPADSVGAVAAAGVALVSRYGRASSAPAVSDSVMALAWWGDGPPAAVERIRGNSCVREVGIAIPGGSDLLLSPSADGLLEALRTPCGGVRVPAPQEGVGAGRAQQVSADDFRAGTVDDQQTRPRWLGVALLALAIGALLTEWLLRRGLPGEPS